LSEHLLPGLSPKGVPKKLKNSVFTFRYNDFDELLGVVQNNNIGVIKMEVIRNVQPKDNFLKKVRDLATKKNIVLIFDECSSGFRETFGGIFQKYNVEPDMVMFGKTIGNGYALTAVLGKQNIMEAAQNSFISSTFWTERIGPTAALETLKVMEREKSWEIITQIGKKMQEGWTSLASKYGLSITISGIPAMASYKFNSENFLKYKTLISQEMLKKGVLASTIFYACTEHKDEHINHYLFHLDEVFSKIAKCESEILDINNLLENPVCHAGFKRLN
jgi:glutamate-1-semialdehyde aminotransferase